MQLQISNPQMQQIFETQFGSNSDKFMQFIVSFLHDNSQIIDNYLHTVLSAKKSKKFVYQKLNPMDNFYELEKDESDIEMNNPFKNVEDSVAFAKKLREESYR